MKATVIFLTLMSGVLAFGQLTYDELVTKVHQGENPKDVIAEIRDQGLAMNIDVDLLKQLKKDRMPDWLIDAVIDWDQHRGYVYTHAMGEDEDSSYVATGSTSHYDFYVRDSWRHWYDHRYTFYDPFGFGFYPYGAFLPWRYFDDWYAYAYGGYYGRPWWWRWPSSYYYGYGNWYAPGPVRGEVVGRARIRGGQAEGAGKAVRTASSVSRHATSTTGSRIKSTSSHASDTRVRSGSSSSRVRSGPRASGSRSSYSGSSSSSSGSRSAVRSASSRSRGGSRN